MRAEARRSLRVPSLLASLLAFGLGLGACQFGGADPNLPDSRNAWVDAVLAAEDRRDAADPRLALALRHGDPVVRMFAYRALGRIGDPATLPAIAESAFQERESELKAEAVAAVGATRSARVVEIVEPFAVDPAWRVRSAVARALGRAETDRALPPLFDLLLDADPDVRHEAAMAIARRIVADRGLLTARSLDAFRSLATMLRDDPNPRARAGAAWAVGKLDQQEFAPALTSALADPDPTVRAFAAVGLQTLTIDGAARLELIRVLGDAYPTVVVEAAKALERAPETDTVAALSPLVRDASTEGHPSLHVRAAAVRALGACAKVEGGDVASKIAPSFDDPSPSVRAEALDAFVAAAEPQLAIERCEAVLAAAPDGAPAATFLRGRVAAAAARLGDAGWPLVERLLDDPSPAVRAAALAALPSYAARGPALHSPLLDALAEHDVAPREAAARAIGELKRTDLADALLAALSDSGGPEFIEARLAAIEAFAALGLYERAEDLRPWILDPEPEVRRVARERVARLGGLLPRAEPLLPPEAVAVPRAGIDFLTGDVRPRVKLVTNKGEVELELLVEDAPVHAKAFLARCRQGFYDGLGFHRLVPGFVVQGLDPRGDGYGTGGPSLRSEVNEHRYDRGVVGMPDAGADTGGCQLFVTFRAQPRLDDRYTVFARVTGGMEVVERLDVGDRVEYVLAPRAEEAEEAEEAGG